MVLVQREEKKVTHNLLWFLVTSKPPPKVLSVTAPTSRVSIGIAQPAALSSSAISCWRAGELVLCRGSSMYRILERSRHCLLMHFCLILPGPPYLGISLQNLQRRQSTAFKHASHSPHLSRNEMSIIVTGYMNQFTSHLLLCFLFLNFLTSLCVGYSFLSSSSFSFCSAASLSALDSNSVTKLGSLSMHRGQ